MRKILVIDNDDDTLLLVKKLLEKNGYTVMTASRAIQAIKIIYSFEPEIIVMDTKIGCFDGRDLCREIKRSEKTRHITVIFFSGNAIPSGGTKEYGYDGFIQKPVNPQTLLHELDKYYMHYIADHL